MFFGEEDSPFQNLPPEMIVEVLSFADIGGKKNARLVCRRWRWILDHPTSGLLYFTLKRRKTTEGSMKYLLKSQVHIDYLKLKHFKMTWPVMTYCRNKFPPIRAIRIKYGNSEQTVLTILQYGCTETESLMLSCRAFGLVRPDILSRLLSEVKWTQLTVLLLAITTDVTASRIARNNWPKSYKNSFKNHSEGIIQIFKKVKLPNIRTLSFLMWSFEKNEISAEILKLMSKFMGFIERHCNTLKGLGVLICFLSDDEEIATTFPNIPSPIFSAEQQTIIAKNLTLDFLEIKVTHLEILLHLVPPFVWDSDKLTTLNWGTFGGVDETTRTLMARPGSPNPIQSLFERNGKTLTLVEAIFIYPEINVDPIQIAWLEFCYALRTLSIQNVHKVLNVQVRLPQVRKLYFDSEDFDTIIDVSAWITRTFRNLAIVQVLLREEVTEEEWQTDWVQNLLLLPRLRQIRFRFSNKYLPLNEKIWIRQFCEGNESLMFKSTKQIGSFHDEVFVIKILPSQNIN